MASRVTAVVHGRDPTRTRRPDAYGFSGASPPCRGNQARKSRDIEAVQVHYLVPRSHEIAHEPVRRAVTCVDFRKRAKLRV
jgi:hypothetical protein